MPVFGNRWYHFAFATAAALSIWAFGALRGYAWQMIWLPAAVAGAAWPRPAGPPLRKCVRRLRRDRDDRHDREPPARGSQTCAQRRGTSTHGAI